MEYYAQGQGAPSSFAGLEGPVSDLSTGAVLTSLPLPEDWHPRHGAHSPASTGADTALEEAVWQMTLQPQDGMDASQGQYPERPGEPDCTYYMRTGLCGFGMSCRFNHPPNRKLAAAVARGKGEYPERHGQPECQCLGQYILAAVGWIVDGYAPPAKPLVTKATCRHLHGEGMIPCLRGHKLSMTNTVQLIPRVKGYMLDKYYLKTGTCKFGATCKYHHPREKAGSTGRVQLNVLALPLRPGEKECAYYMRTGSCKYSVTCKFHHPPPTAVGALVPISSSIYAAGGTSMPAPQPYPGGLPTWSLARAPYLSSPRLQGPSSYGPMLLPAQGIVSMPGWSTYQGPVGPIASPEGQQHPIGTGYVYTQQTDPVSGGVHGNFPPYLPGTTAMGHPALQGQQLGPHKETIFPERPGQPECQYYMKTGDCKFGITCKYHHPKDRATPSPTCGLSRMGLPLRPGAQPCTFYTRYGICKFGPTCKFDHPLGGLPYSPSASSLTDMPVAPYPIGGGAITVATSSEGPSDPPPSTSSTSNEVTTHPEGSLFDSQTREGSNEVAQTTATASQAGQVLSLQGLGLGTSGISKPVDILGTS